MLRGFSSRLPVRDLSVVVPAYNEAHRIGATLDRILSYGLSRFERLEVLVVDDGSTDGTADLVERGWVDPVRVIRRRRGGKGAAVRSGVAAARGAWVLLVDADLSIPIEEVEKLLPFSDTHAIVIGSKRAPGSSAEYAPLRRLLGGIGQRVIALCVVSGFHDTQCGFKLFRADVARELFALQTIDGFGYDFEVLFLARRYAHAVREVPVCCAHRLGGSVRLKTYWSVLADVCQLWSNRRRGIYPAVNATRGSARAR